MSNPKRYFGTQSKVGAAQQEKNLWKRRAAQAEGALKHLRNVADNPDSSDGEIVDTVFGVLNDWEELYDKYERSDLPKCKRCRGTGVVNEPAEEEASSCAPSA